MDVSFRYRAHLTKTATDKFEIFLPLVFENIKSGPDGFVTIYVDEFSLDAEHVKINSSPEIYSSTPGNRDFAKETVIETPVPFRDTGSGHNRLALRLRGTGDVSWLEGLSAGRVPVSMKMTVVFIGGQVIVFQIDGEISPDGEVMVEMRPRRTSRPVLALVNFSALLISIGTLALWQTTVNQNVYLQETKQSQEYLLVLIGGYLAFFGLSLAKIKRWISSLSDIRGFLRFPELHLGTQLFQNFSSPLCSVFLALGASGATVLFLQLWSYPYHAFIDPALEATPARVSIYDTRESAVVPAGKRLYASHLNNSIGSPSRLRYYCSQDASTEGCNDSTAEYSSTRRYIGSLEVGTAPLSSQLVLAEIFEQDSASAEPIATDVQSVRTWIQNPTSTKLKDSSFMVRRILCDNQWSPPGSTGTELRAVQKCRWSSGEAVVVEADPLGAKLSRIAVHRQKHFTAKELADAFSRHKGTLFVGRSPEDVFHGRAFSSNSLLAELRTSFELNGVTTSSEIVEALQLLLKEAKDAHNVERHRLSKALVERFAYFKALLRILDQTSSTEISDEDLKRFCETLRQFVDSDRGIGWRTVRVATEVAIEAGSVFSHPRATELAHDVVASQWPSSLPKNWSGAQRERHRWRVTDYISSVLYLNQATGKHRSFLEGAIPAFFAQTGPDKLAELLVYREVIGPRCLDGTPVSDCGDARGDYSLDWLSLRHQMASVLDDLMTATN